MSRTHRTSTLLVLASITAAALAGAEPAPHLQACEPQVKALLLDGHRLVPGGLAPLRRAVGDELRRLGLQLAWIKDEDSQEAGFVLRVALLPHDAREWGRSGKTLGAVHWEEGSSSPVFVLYPAVKQVLGAPTDTTSILGRPSGSHWTKGLARIIAHEILHVLLPGRPHDATGLFAQNLKQRDLLGPKLELDPETQSALFERLCIAAS